MALNWKIAAAGGAALGLGLGGLTLAGADDTDRQPVRDIDLQSARDALSSLSSPIRVTTTVPDDSPVAPVATPAPAPTPDASASMDSPVTVAPAPAPAPAPADDSASPVQPQSGGDDSASAASGAST